MLVGGVNGSSSRSSTRVDSVIGGESGMAGGKMSSCLDGYAVIAKPVVVGRGDSMIGSPGTSSVTVKGNSDSAGKI